MRLRKLTLFDFYIITEKLEMASQHLVVLWAHGLHLLFPLCVHYTVHWCVPRSGCLESPKSEYFRESAICR